MNVFEGLEKIITEHGSAAALNGRIELIKAQHALLEKRCTELERALAEAGGALETALEENRAWKAQLARVDVKPVDDVDAESL